LKMGKKQKRQTKKRKGRMKIKILKRISLKEDEWWGKSECSRKTPDRDSSSATEPQ